MFSKHPGPWNPAAGRPSDDQLMGLLRARLAEIAPEVAAGSRVDHGVLEGRGWSWVALPNHTGRPSHFDIGFTLGPPDPDSPDTDDASDVIADCISGTGPLTDAVSQVLDVWARTSGACFVEMVSAGGPRAAAASPPASAQPAQVPESARSAEVPGSARSAEVPGSARSAEVPGPARPAGVPGWVCVVSDVIGYGGDGTALPDALRSRPVLRELSLNLPHDRRNGIKVYLHKTPAETTAEVRVNGVVDAAASQSLAAMEWPAVKAPTTARFYAVAVHPE